MSAVKEHQTCVHCYVPSVVEWAPQNTLYGKHFYGMGGPMHNATCSLRCVKDQHFYDIMGSLLIHNKDFFCGLEFDKIGNGWLH